MKCFFMDYCIWTIILTFTLQSRILGPKEVKWQKVYGFFPPPPPSDTPPFFGPSLRSSTPWDYFNRLSTAHCSMQAVFLPVIPLHSCFASLLILSSFLSSFLSHYSSKAHMCPSKQFLALSLREIIAEYCRISFSQTSPGPVTSASTVFVVILQVPVSLLQLWVSCLDWSNYLDVFLCYFLLHF